MPQREGRSAGRLVDLSNSIYDQIVVQSEVERKFAEELKLRRDVRLFVKLPAWFKIATPVGAYNPDWALVMDPADGGDVLRYLVGETKSTTDPQARRGVENLKIDCGERHFVGALRVDFKDITSVDELT